MAKRKTNRHRRDPRPSPSTPKRFASHEAAIHFANENLGFEYRITGKAPGRVHLQNSSGKRLTLVWPSRDPAKRRRSSAS